VGSLVEARVMAEPKDLAARLRAFVDGSRFASAGGIITDLDGTAVHETGGKVVIPRDVELGLKRLNEQGRPVVINTLRFPLSVLRTFGRDWYAVGNAPIPAITLNGSLLGWITLDPAGAVSFEEIAATIMARAEVEAVLEAVGRLLAEGVEDLLVFHYPRDWRMGEAVWTPLASRIDAVRAKYRSASSVTAVAFDKLREQMLREELCMIFLHIDLPQDRLMAYQHAQRSSFFTASGIDKASGAADMARRRGFSLPDSLGAGDTTMDRFLAQVGLAAVVGASGLPYRGLRDTIHVADSHALGRLLFQLAGLQREAAHGPA
jgi:hypothetical protein